MPHSREDDQRFARDAVEQGFLTAEEIAQAREAQDKARDLGIDLSLTEVTLKLGLLDPVQVEVMQPEEVEREDKTPSEVELKGRGDDDVIQGQTLLTFRGQKEGDGETGEGEAGLGPDERDTFLAEKTPEPAEGKYEAGERETEGPEGPATAEEEGGRSKRQIGPYRIISEIGRGGMGIVYRAFDPNLKRTVALKVLIGGEDASEAAIARFHREAESVARLGHHPGIVPVYDIGTQGNLHYFAMHYVEGKSVAQMVRGGALQSVHAMEVAEKVCYALQFAHTQGVLHRDVKPDNILVDKDSNPNLTDFGLAKDVKEESNLTVSGTAMGTPQYMPPEQAEGKLDKVDARSDVYAVGATLYEMLTGKPPFEATTFTNLLVQIMTKEPAPPSKTNPAVPRDAQTICLKALEKDRDRRYQSCQEMAADIRRFLKGEAILARPASIMYRVSKQVRRNPALYITGIVAIILVAAAAIFFLGIKPTLDRNREMAEDMAVLEKALAGKLGPEGDATELLEKASAFLKGGDFDLCIEVCDSLVQTYKPRQGTSLKNIPAVRHQILLGEKRFLPLFRPFSFPIAQAMALKAQALAGAGKEKASLDAWLLAYAQAKPSRDAEEAAVAGPALLQIGKRLLSLRDLEQATETFQKFIRAHGDSPDIGQAWLGLAEALWTKGRFPEAREAFRRVTDHGGLNEEEEASATWYMRQCSHLSQRRKLPRMTGHVFPGDMNGDGMSEIFRYDPRQGLTVYNFRDGDFVKRFFLPQSDMFPPAAFPKARIHGLSYREFFGKGRGALTARVDMKGKRHVWIRPLDGAGNLGEPVLQAMALTYCNWGDMDGDGIMEIVLTTSTNPRQFIEVMRLDGDRFTSVGRVQQGSYNNYRTMVDIDGDGREEYVACFGEFSHWQAWVLRVKNPEGTLEFLPLSPYRYLGPFLGFTDGPEGKKYVWIRNSINSDGRRILGSIAEERHVLPSGGFYRVTPFSEEKPVDYAASFPGAKPYVHNGHWLEHDNLFVGQVRFGDLGETLGFRSADPEKHWCFWPLPKKKRWRGYRVVNLDEDPDAEIMLFFDEGMVIMGSGEKIAPEEELLLGVDRESVERDAMENAVLATAIEMNAMGWTEQALELFRKAREGASNDFETRRSRLGEADCLLKLNKPEEAVAIYRELVRASALGITEELFSAAKHLEARGAWKELNDLLKGALESTPLPRETAAWARDLKARTDPLVQMNYKTALVPVERDDDSFMARHALKVPGMRDRKEGFDFWVDGSRRSCFGRLINYDGGPFRMELRFTLHHLDWTCYANLGLFRVCRNGDTTAAARDAHIFMEAGHCSNVPALKISMRTSVGSASLGTVQTHPRTLPVDLLFVVEYAPSMDRISVTMKDFTLNKEVLRSSKTHTTFPRGKYVLALVGSQQQGPASFRSRVFVKRFEFYSPSRHNEATDWEPEANALALLRAGGALAVGDYRRAVEYAELVTDDGPCLVEDYGIAYWEESAVDPSRTARARLIQAMAYLRVDDRDGFLEALSQAMGKDPARSLWYLQRCFEALSPAERDAIGAALRHVLVRDGAKLGRALARYYAENPKHKPRDLRPAPDAYFRGLENVMARAAAAKDPAALNQALFQVLYNLTVVPLPMHAFKGTALEKEARLRCLLRYADHSEYAGDGVHTDRILQGLMNEFPKNPEVQNVRASFLARPSMPRFRDVKKALALSNQAVATARIEGSEHAKDLWLFLYTQARIHFMLEHFEQALKAQQEATKLLPPGRTQARTQFEKMLSMYRKKCKELREKEEREKQDGKGR